MARITDTTATLTSPGWAGDYLNREHLIPGGAKVDPAGWSADSAGRKPIPSGTAVGRTFAERDAGTGYGPAGDADDEVYLVAFDVTDAVLNSDVELYRPNSVVKETYVPGFAGLSAAVKAKLRAAYVCTVGVR